MHAEPVLIGHRHHPEVPSANFPRVNALDADSKMIISYLVGGLDVRYTAEFMDDVASRLTNAFSKKVDNHLHMLSLYSMHYNFCRIHKSLRVTPAMEAGVSDVLRDMEWVCGLIDARAPKPGRPKTYKKR